MLRDSIFVLKGFVAADGQPVEIMIDTEGQRHYLWPVPWLLGYQFSPRPADAGEAVFGAG